MNLVDMGIPQTHPRRRSSSSHICRASLTRGESGSRHQGTVICQRHCAVGGRRKRRARGGSQASRSSRGAIGWAGDNGTASGQGKTEAAFFRRRESLPPASIRAGDKEVPFNKEATRWLGVWLGNQLTLKVHHTNRMKIEGRL